MIRRPGFRRVLGAVAAFASLSGFRDRPGIVQPTIETQAPSTAPGFLGIPTQTRHVRRPTAGAHDALLGQVRHYRGGQPPVWIGVLRSKYGNNQWQWGRR